MEDYRGMTREKMEALFPTTYKQMAIPPPLYNASAQTLQNLRFARLETALGNVGLMREIPGIATFDLLWERAVLRELFGSIVRVPCLGDMIAISSASHDRRYGWHLAALSALQESGSGSGAHSPASNKRKRPPAL